MITALLIKDYYEKYIWPKHDKVFGWQLIEKEGNITTSYCSLTVGIKEEYIRPILAPIYCSLAGHTHGRYGYCKVCDKSID